MLDSLRVCVRNSSPLIQTVTELLRLILGSRLIKEQSGGESLLIQERFQSRRGQAGQPRRTSALPPQTQSLSDGLILSCGGALISLRYGRVPRRNDAAVLI